MEYDKNPIKMKKEGNMPFEPKYFSGFKIISFYLKPNY